MDRIGADAAYRDAFDDFLGISGSDDAAGSVSPFFDHRIDTVFSF